MCVCVCVCVTMRVCVCYDVCVCVYLILQWRDHWLQAVQLLPEPLTVNEGTCIPHMCLHRIHQPLHHQYHTIGDHISVGCRHDDYSMWFHVHPPSPPSPLKGRISPHTSPPSPHPSPERPVCTCGVHTAWSRSRIAMHNDTARTQLHLNALTQVLYICQ